MAEKQPKCEQFDGKARLHFDAALDMIKLAAFVRTVAVRAEVNEAGLADFMAAQCGGPKHPVDCPEAALLSAVLRAVLRDADCASVMVGFRFGPPPDAGLDLIRRSAAEGGMEEMSSLLRRQRAHDRIEASQDRRKEGTEDVS